ncbi:MAG: twin-arginine translocase subunit TatC [Anaerolineae bacterium]
MAEKSTSLQHDEGEEHGGAGSAKSGDKEMSLTEHLEELRYRLLVSVVALLVGTMASLAITKPFLQLLISPMGDRTPVSLKPTENVITFFKIALILGAALAMPVILYQLINFIVPGLTEQERRYLFIIIPSATGLFILGVGFAAFVMLPASIQFLQGFLSDIIQPTYSIDYYISFVTTLLFWTGVIFETPLLIAFLARLGVVSPGMLLRNWKYVVILIAIIAAVITPTPDPVNMSLFMVPLLLLYLLSIGLARLTYPGQARRAVREQAQG